jgi:hypothetical protein
MALTAALRKLTYTMHVTSSAGWVGAALVFLSLAIIGLSSSNEATVRGAYLVMVPSAWFVLVPLAHVSLFSGLVLSLGTRWGLFQHYWIVLKLAITAFSTVVLLIYMGTFREMAGVAADPIVELALVRNPSPVVHAVLALILLLIATALAVYKPFGMTPYGQRLAAAAPRSAAVASHLRARRDGGAMESRLPYLIRPAGGAHRRAADRSSPGRSECRSLAHGRGRRNTQRHLSFRSRR